MKIGIIQRSDVTNICCLSGVPYFTAKALEEHVGRVILLGPDDSSLTRAIEFACRCLNRLCYVLLGRHTSSDHNRILSKRLAHTFASRLLKSECDVIFAPVASVEIAFLQTDIPIIYMSDLTWANIIDYYPGCVSLFGFANAEGERIEAAAIKNASALIYPSEWAARGAVEHYRADAHRVHCIPYGANFERGEIPSFDAALHHPLEGPLRLLWTGVDWERKGGPIAYECLVELLRRGVDAKLVICGCVPPTRYDHAKVEVIPFLDKRDLVQRRRLSELFLDANFFLFPTIAEAYGIVLCEASAHGLPSLARDTGGVGGAVSDGENGYLMPPDARGQQYAEKILDTVGDHCLYERLVVRSRKAYEDRLNWDAWGRAAKSVFEQMAEGKVTSSVL